MGKAPHSATLLISGIAAAALIVAPLPDSGAAFAISRVEYEACQARDEQAFRAAVEALTHKGLQAGTADLDYRALVAAEWQRGNVDDVIDRQVDEAIAQVRDESSWFQLWQSLASQDKAQELATAAAERVYRSDPLKDALAALATGVGKEIGKRIEAATVDTAEPVTQCMQAFLGPRYGTTIAGVVAADAGKEYSIDPAKAAAQVSAGQVLIQGTEGVTGAVILLARRQLARMASRLGQRLLGSVLGRLVSVVAGGIGVVLIAKDVWDFRYGVLPIISEEMKSRATKDSVREELTRSIAEQIHDGIKEISEKTADRVVEIWHEYRRAHAKVLELAEKQEAFRRFLETVKPNDLPKLDEIVAIVLASEGEAGIARRLTDGTLHSAVSSLPAAALEIVREARSLEVGLQWQAIAGDSLPKVVDYEIHRRAKPEAFTKASLQRLLGLQDRVAVTRLASLQPAARDALFELDGTQLTRLARTLQESELDSLSGYLTGLEPASAQRLLSAVAMRPSRMSELASPYVRQAILASRDQAAAVGMMLQSSTLPNPGELISHAQLVLDGRISPLLLWQKHPVALSVLALVALALLLLLKRLLFGTRPKIVVHQVSDYPGRGRGGRG